MTKHSIVTVLVNGVKTRLVLGDIDCALRMMDAINRLRHDVYVIDSLLHSSRVPHRDNDEWDRMRELCALIRSQIWGLDV
jgi:hypothetical protein